MNDLYFNDFCKPSINSGAEITTFKYACILVSIGQGLELCDLASGTPQGSGKLVMECMGWKEQCHCFPIDKFLSPRGQMTCQCTWDPTCMWEARAGAMALIQYVWAWGLGSRAQSRAPREGTGLEGPTWSVQNQGQGQGWGGRCDPECVGTGLGQQAQSRSERCTFKFQPKKAYK